ncbi:MAG: NAD(P)-dependent oxidoreductase [Pseudomonadota bacterium]
MSLHSLPVFVRLGGRPVMLIGEGEAADAKRRLLERAGAVIVGEEAEAALAIVALDDPDATVTRVKARGVLVNAVDRPDLCDFTLPAIVDRSPVIVAIGTGGASAGLAAALRQRLEAILPATLGGLADALHAARAVLRERFPDGGERRRALGAAMAAGGALDPLSASPLAVENWLFPREGGGPESRAVNLATLDPRLRGGTVEMVLTSPDPDDLTLRQARALAQADRIIHAPDVPPAILDRARADAVRIASSAPPGDAAEGLTVFVEMAR